MYISTILISFIVAGAALIASTSGAPVSTHHPTRHHPTTRHRTTHQPPLTIDELIERAEYPTNQASPQKSRVNDAERHRSGSWKSADSSRTTDSDGPTDSESSTDSEGSTVSPDPSNYVAAVDLRTGSVRTELDMVYTAEQWNLVNEDTGTTPSRQKRKAWKYLSMRWPFATIPFEYQTGVYTNNQKRSIEAAMAHWSKETCIRFRPATPIDDDRVVIQDRGACYSYIGKIGGPQPISLAPGCLYHGVITHEIGHAVGWVHEHTRPDRDSYVTIHDDAIIPKHRYNFHRYSSRHVNTYGVEYDYRSVMHYGSRYFSKDGRPTITPKDRRFISRFGNRDGLSFRDVKGANLMYDCAARANCPAIQCPGEGFVDKHCKCQCPTGRSRPPTKECTPLTTTTHAPPTTTTTTTPTTTTTTPITTTTTPTTTTPTTTTTTPTTTTTTPSTTTTTTTHTTTTPTTTSTHPPTTTTTLSPPTTSSTTTTTTSPTNCQDRPGYPCGFYSTRFNACNVHRFKAFMRRTCPSTCGTCKPTVVEVCEDKKLYLTWCPMWRDFNFCTQGQYLGNWMKTNCPKSCGHCS